MKSCKYYFDTEAKKLLLIAHHIKCFYNLGNGGLFELMVQHCHCPCCAAWTIRPPVEHRDILAY